jgi:hypothetical protein
MQSLKTTVIALGALALSSAALAHGHAYGHEQRYRREARRVVVVEPRYETRYQPRCENVQRIAYVPARLAECRPVVAIQPGIRVQIGFTL